MANKEFRDIEDFIDGFTKESYYDQVTRYDGIIWGMEFKYHGRYFRVTRDTNGDEPELRKIFGEDKCTDIKLFEIPPEIFPDAPGLPECTYIGVYKDVYDLLDNGKIDGVPLRDIIASEKTVITGTD